jgi:hypothetical protein
VDLEGTFQKGLTLVQENVDVETFQRAMTLQDKDGKTPDQYCWQSTDQVTRDDLPQLSRALISSLKVFYTIMFLGLYIKNYI